MMTGKNNFFGYQAHIQILIDSQLLHVKDSEDIVVAMAVPGSEVSTLVFELILNT